MGQKVFVLLAEGFEEIEALTPVDYLRRSGISTILVAVGGKHASSGGLTVTGAHGITVLADLAFNSLKTFVPLPDAVYIPGGMPGAKNLSENADISGFISAVYHAGHIIAAICASPAVVLAKTGILKGKKFTCYGHMEDEIPRWAGSRWRELTDGSQKIDKSVVCDGSLLTGRAPGAAEELSLALIQALCGNEKALEVAKGAACRNFQ